VERYRSMEESRPAVIGARITTVIHGGHFIALVSCDRQECGAFKKRLLALDIDLYHHSLILMIEDVTMQDRFALESCVFR
jgi:hypothetical protein